MKNSFEQVILECDFAVIGGGPAGFASAVSASRLGMKTILVTDRPAIGGNHGQEVRVCISGAGHRPWMRYTDETGVMHEALQRWGYRSRCANGLKNWIDMDIVYGEMIDAEDNLRVIFNTLINDVELDNAGRIVSVSGNQSRSEKHYTIKAPLFADCTGDSTVGYLAGADFRLGREAKNEFNEPGAPEKEDSTTMGATLCFSSRSAGKPVDFVPVKGAINFHDWKPEDFPYVGKAWSQRPDGEFGMLWWAEVGGLINQISSAPDIELECRKVVLGIWDYIKNSGKFQKVEEQYIDWMAALPGKRESRRLLGDYIINENDLWEQNDFTDAVGFTGYMIDVHPAGGYKNPNWAGSVHRFQPGASDIPLRSLYSRNIPNLFMAGRNISTTQQGMGSTRVAGTCAVTGQSIAHAAKICTSENTMPGKLTGGQVKKVQQLLLRSDCSIHGYTIRDDLLQKAKVSASSVRPFSLTAGNQSIPLEKAQGVFIPNSADVVNEVELFFETDKPAEIKLAFYTCNRDRNYRLNNLICEKAFEIKESGWQKIALGIKPGAGQKIICVILPAVGVSLKASEDRLTSVLPVTFETDNKETIPCYETPYKVNNLTPLFKISPEQDLFAAESVTDGYIRPLSLPHVWSSGSLKDGAQSIEFEFENETEISRIELVFNSDQDVDHMIDLDVCSLLVKSFRLEAIANEDNIELAADNNNFIRFRTFDFAPVKVRKLKLTITESWGHDHAEVFSIRAY